MNVPVPTLDIVNNRQGEVVEEPEHAELNTDELKDAVSAAEGLDSSDYTAESCRRSRKLWQQQKTLWQMPLPRRRSTRRSMLWRVRLRT